jgi:hypothetical protein
LDELKVEFEASLLEMRRRVQKNRDKLFDPKDDFGFSFKSKKKSDIAKDKARRE